MTLGVPCGIGGCVRLLLIAVIVLGTAGCGGGEAELTKSAGSRLAAKSDRVAARLAAGDSCGAKRSAAAIRVEEVRGEAARELSSRTNALFASITCVPPAAPPPASPQPYSEGDGEEDEGDD